MCKTAQVIHLLIRRKKSKRRNSHMVVPLDYHNTIFHYIDISTRQYILPFTISPFFPNINFMVSLTLSFRPHSLPQPRCLVNLLKCGSGNLFLCFFQTLFSSSSSLFNRQTFSFICGNFPFCPSLFFHKFQPT